MIVPLPELISLATLALHQSDNVKRVYECLQKVPGILETRPFYLGYSVLCQIDFVISR